MSVTVQSLGLAQTGAMTGPVSVISAREGGGGAPPAGDTFTDLHIDMSAYTTNWIGINEVYFEDDTGTERFSNTSMTGVASGTTNNFSTIVNGEYTSDTNYGAADTIDHIEDGIATLPQWSTSGSSGMNLYIEFSATYTPNWIGVIFENTGTYGTPSPVFKDNTTTITPDSSERYSGSVAGEDLWKFYFNGYTPSANILDYTYDSGKTLDFSAKTSTNYGATMSADGTKLYVCGNAEDRIYQYVLSTAHDPSSGTYDGEYDFTAEIGNAVGVSFNDDGTKMYITSYLDDTIYQYSLTTAWDVTGTVSYDSKSFDYGTQAATGYQAKLGSGGDKLYVLHYSTEVLYQYSLSTTDDVSSASYDSKSLSITGGINCHGYDFSADGKTLWFADNDGTGTMRQYRLSTAWDISTATENEPFTITTLESNLTGTSLRGLNVFADQSLFVVFGNEDCNVWNV